MAGVEHSVPVEISAEPFVVPVTIFSHDHLPTGAVRDILHIPKTLLT
jgi:hypothetical protein